MAENVTINYDEAADTLYISFCEPYPEQETVELDSGVVAQMNPETGAIEYLELRFWSRRLERSPALDILLPEVPPLEDTPTTAARSPSTVTGRSVGTQGD